MHIPDGYLGPQTYAPLLGTSTVFWTIGLKRLKKQLPVREVPYLAMAAAFSFIIMMFNIPVPGGTSGHAVGAAVIALLLGPWTAVIAVSVVLVIQAVVFGDGGVTALGANCFNMAVILPFVAWWVFRLAGGGARRGARAYAAAFLAGYAGLVAAAAATGIEFGIQPLIAHAPDGSPLYAPYPLSVALPAMVGSHLIFGLLEGVITMLVMKFFMSREAGGAAVLDDAGGPAFRKRAWLALAALAVLSPLGIIIPEMFRAGGAWGEWDAETLKRMLGYLPQGLGRLSGIWKAPVADYGGGGVSAVEVLAYIGSGILGIALAGVVIYAIARLLLGGHRQKPVRPGHVHGQPGMKGIPPFLLEKPSLVAPQGGGVVKVPFIDKSISHLAGVIRTSYFQWDTASQAGFFQGLDGRVKVLFLAFFLVIVSLKKDLTGQSAIFLFVMFLVAVSGLSLVVIYRRVLFFGFIFGFLVAFPASLNVITKGDVVLHIVSLDSAHDLWIYHIPKDIGLTKEGLTGVSILTMRVMNSLSLTLFVLYTTPFTEIIRALKVMGVPDAFLVIINLAYKYIFIFARTVEDMHLAKKSRQVGAIGDSEARRWVAGRLALLFRKTQIRCEEIFKAMLSRGFSGEVRLPGFRRLSRRDWAAGASVAILGAVFLWI